MGNSSSQRIQYKPIDLEAGPEQLQVLFFAIKQRL